MFDTAKSMHERQTLGLAVVRDYYATHPSAFIHIQEIISNLQENVDSLQESITSEMLCRHLCQSMPLICPCLLRDSTNGTNGAMYYHYH